MPFKPIEWVKRRRAESKEREKLIGNYKCRLPLPSKELVAMLEKHSPENVKLFIDNIDTITRAGYGSGRLGYNLWNTRVTRDLLFGMLKGKKTAEQEAVLKELAEKKPTLEIVRDSLDLESFGKNIGRALPIALEMHDKHYGKMPREKYEQMLRNELVGMNIDAMIAYYSPELLKTLEGATAKEKTRVKKFLEGFRGSREGARITGFARSGSDYELAGGETGELADFLAKKIRRTGEIEKSLAGTNEAYHRGYELFMKMLLEKRLTPEKEALLVKVSDFAAETKMQPYPIFALADKMSREGTDDKQVLEKLRRAQPQLQNAQPFLHDVQTWQDHEKVSGAVLHHVMKTHEKMIPEVGEKAYWKHIKIFANQLKAGKTNIKVR